MTDERILVGLLGAPHGVRGDLRLKSYTQDPLAILSYAPLTDRTGHRLFAVESARALKGDVLLVRLQGVDDRDKAAALTGTRLFVPRERLPAPTDEDEFYHADLIGLAVEAQDGSSLGHVQAVLNFGAGDLIEIRPPDGGPARIWPFTKAVFPHIDLAARRILAEPPVETDGEGLVSKIHERSG